MTKIAPMTAAEYRMIHGGEIRTVGGRRLLAALEEREALLGKLARATRALTRIGYTDCGGEEWKPPLGDRSDASVGALVRRIREEKPFAYLTWSGSPGCFALDKNGLTFALDSLLPKEPEVVTGESGRQYRRTGGKAIEARHICADGSPTYWATVGGVPVIDAPVVAKLMAKGGKDGE